MDSVAILIAETPTVNDIGQEVMEETTRQVFCNARSVTRSEFYDAANAGLQPEVVLTLSTHYDYEGERLVEWSGERYTVMRVYQAPDSDALELTLERVVANHG